MTQAAVAPDAELRAQSTIGLFRPPSMVFAAATAAVGVANFLFHPIVAHRLTLDEYGALGALLGFLMVLAVPVAAMQLVIARDIVDTRRATGVDPSLRELFVKSIVIAVVASLVTAFAMPLIDRAFHLTDRDASILLALTVLPTVVQVVPVAILLAESRFILASVAILIGPAIRLMSASHLASHYGLNGALWSGLIGSSVAAVFAVLAARIARHRHPTEGQPSLDIRAALIGVIGLTGFWALHAVHPMVARVFLDSGESGRYAAAATLGQLGVFVPAFVASRAFPVMALAKGKGPVARAQLVRATVIVAPLAILIACITTFAGEYLSRRLLGPGYAPDFGVLGFVSLSAAVAAIVYLLIYFFLAGRSRVGGITAWGGVAVFCLGALWMHQSALSLAVLSALTTIAVVLTLGIFASTKGRVPATSSVGTAENALWSSDVEPLDLTMVIPFYNPGPGFVDNILELARTLDTDEVTYEIIAVSDGSTDESADALERLRHERVRLVRQERNAGKGEALRVGLSMGRGHYLGFIDADGDIAPEILSNYLMIMRAYEPDIIFGSKRHPLSQIEYPLVRRIYSFGYQMIIRLLFRVDVRDTQVGLKLVRRDVLAAVLPRMLEKRFAFDLELFVVSKLIGYRRMFEAPVVINHGTTSTVSWRSVRGVFLDTAAIFYRLHLLHFYDEPQSLDVDGHPVETRSRGSVVEL